MSTDDDDPAENRRSFLRKLGSYGLIAIVTGAAGKLGETLVKPFMGSIEAGVDFIAHEELGFVKGIGQDARYLAKKLLFGTEERIAIVPSENNPYAGTSGITAPTRYLGTRLKSVLADAPEHFRPAKEIRLRDLEGNILCLGHPISNELSRQIMGHHGKSRLVREHVDGVDVKFPCTLDHDESKKAIASGIFRKGKNGPVPVWHFRTPDGLLVPEIRNGDLETDYLHIVSLPNFLSAEAYGHNRRITIAFGSHGAGTRALAILFEREQKLMADLLEKVKAKKIEAWHAILLVDRVSYQAPVSLGALPIGIYPITGKFGRIAEILTKEAKTIDRG